MSFVRRTTNPPLAVAINNGGSGVNQVIRSCLVYQQILMYQRLVVRQTHGTYYREPRLRVAFFFNIF